MNPGQSRTRSPSTTRLVFAADLTLSLRGFPFPGAWAHYSYALRDAVDACDSPVVEVHISNVSVHFSFLLPGMTASPNLCRAKHSPARESMPDRYAREEFRHKSVTAPIVAGYIAGCGILGYELGLRTAIQRRAERDALKKGAA